jgi:hypothetical protein
MSDIVNLIKVPLIEMGEDKARERKGYFYSINCRHNIVMGMSIARQRLRKHIPKVTLSKVEGYLLLGNGPTNMNS